MPEQKAFRVLLVDDDPQVLKLFTTLLRRGGYIVTPARTGRDALRRLESGPEVDVMVLDLDMPDLNGFDVLRALRQARPLPILAVSGAMGDALLVPAELLGASAALSKVDAPKRLLGAVNDLLKPKPRRLLS